MSSTGGLYDGVSVELGDDFVATVEIHKPPNNYLDGALTCALADTYEALDADPACRAIVLCSEGENFCTGVALAPNVADPAGHLQARLVCHHALRIFAAKTPVVAAVQGAAAGGGLGLAMSADFRVGSPASRLWANFTKIGLHHGFGITVSLPSIVGQQAALDLFLTNRRVDGEEALRLGLCDRLAPVEELRAAAHEFAAEIATSAPLAVRSIRQNLRSELLSHVRAATEREGGEREWLIGTHDIHEGVRTASERRIESVGHQ